MTRIVIPHTGGPPRTLMPPKSHSDSKQRAGISVVSV